jgi:hypothetical protein
MDQNINTLNQAPDRTAKLIEAGLKPKDSYDPILDDPISDGSAESEAEESEESEEGLKIDFPRENAAELLTFLHREITNLQNMEDA